MVRKHTVVLSMLQEIKVSNAIKIMCFRLYGVQRDVVESGFLYEGAFDGQSQSWNEDALQVEAVAKSQRVLAT